MEITTQNQLLDLLIKYNNEGSPIYKIYYDLHLSGTNQKYSELLEINKAIFKNYTFQEIRFSGFKFKNCQFNNCQFRNIDFSACEFESCQFNNIDMSSSGFFESRFENVKIIKSKLSLIHFADVEISKTNFESCHELMDIYWGGTSFKNVNFNECFVNYNRFTDSYRDLEPTIEFNSCLLTRNYFSFLKLTTVKFISSVMNLNSFQNCILSRDSFQFIPNSKGTEFNSVDFTTIAESEILNQNDLYNLFGITAPDIKDYLYGLTNKINFQTVFISYSTENLDFAKKLNNALIDKGIITFLWEKDAPGGKQLKNIMKDNIKKYDRVLFIASEDSLKSPACQFELTEARLKQDKYWKDVYFPITIDDFIFKIQKEDIRPREDAEEYWKNILGLKEFNILDYSSFLKGNNENFEKEIFKLIKDLKK
ncbi:MAG: pentapeptide repeat-containing protein [Cytophagaceae bacterium]|jgi:uncharacterized protein YjbI with pentapeptide repeats|nr:pentapeptide repeat-containing protein [Cytophagaceae bacterium]